MIKTQSALLCVLASFGLMAAYTVGPTHRPAVIPAASCGVPADLSKDIVDTDQAATLIDYPLGDVRSGETAPRLYVVAFPEIAEDEQPEVRKDTFLRALLPMVLAVNESLQTQRHLLTRLAECQEQGAELAPAAMDWLNEMAERYGTPPDPNMLLQQVDIVPPSLALAQAALESGWGQSRFARERNALFGERRAGSDSSSKTAAPREAAAMRLVGFDRPIDAVISYINNLNSHPAYEEFRRVRADMRSQDMPLDSLRLVGTLHRYSERRAAYVRDVRRLITRNSLTDFDTAQLEESQDARQVAER